MSNNVVSLSGRRPPVVYTITIVHHWDDTLEFRVDDVADDPRSREAVMDALQRVSGIQETADALHKYALAQVNSMMAATSDEDVKALAELADIVQAYETARFYAHDAA